MDHASRFLSAFVLVATVFACGARRAEAYIERLYSLEEVLKESSNVILGRIEKIDRTKKRAIVTIERALKGPLEYRRVQVNLDPGPAQHTKYLLERWREGAPFLLFYHRNGQEIASCGHCGDTWFQLFATHEANSDRVWWRFTHVEVWMGRTFDGTSEDLIATTEGVITGKIRAPKPNPKVAKLDVERPPSRAAAAGTSTAETRETPSRVLIPRSTKWRYLKGLVAAKLDAGDSWRSAAFDDSRWVEGDAPFGYGDGPFGTELADMQAAKGRTGYTTLFLRRRFEIAGGDELATLGDLALDVDYDDGFVLYLNGRQAFARNAPKGPLRHDSVASAQHESGTLERFELEDAKRWLVAGANTVAVLVLNSSTTSSDLRFDVEVLARLAGAGTARGGRFRVRQEVRSASSEARGISFADVNGDDLLDVHVSRGTRDVLLVNQGVAEPFTDAGESLGLSSGSRAAGWADCDGDDHPDLLTNQFALATHAGGRFRDASKLLAAPSARNPEGAGWIDFDGDGLPDVLITNGEHGIRLYHNDGGAPPAFTDVSDRAGLGSGARALGRGNGDFVAFTDFDGDGYTDFFYNLAGGVLARNAGDGTFALDRRSGIEIPAGSAESKRGVAFADFDLDGDVDLFVPSRERPRLYRNENDGTFRDVLAGAGDLARVPDASFSATWADVDCDGSLDLFVCVPDATSRLFLGDGRGTFRDATAETGLDALGRGVWAVGLADLDGDRDVDLVASLADRVVILANELPRASGRAPLAVTVRARRGLIGATVRVADRAGKSLGMRELGLATGCGGQQPTTAWFGVPAGDGVPAGNIVVTVARSDGKLASAEVTVGASGATLVLSDERFD